MSVAEAISVAQVGAKQKIEVVGVQYLRATAAILVVMHHALHQLPSLLAMIPTEALQGGVDIFFVISGFIMTYTTATKPLSAGQFLERRVVRIVPLYWAMTAITAVFAISAPHIFKDTVFTLSGFITSLLFIPAYNAGQVGVIAPLLKLGWTLNHEAFFYVVFAALIVLPPFKRSAAILAVLLACVLLLPLLRSDAAPIVFHSTPIALEFAMGCFVGAAAAAGLGLSIPRAGWVCLLVAGIAGFLYFGQNDLGGMSRVLNLGAPSTAIVIAVVWLDRLGVFDQPGPLQRAGKLLGDASYSIYLAHLYPVIGFRDVWLRAHLAGGTVGLLSFLVMATATGIGAGLLVYFFIERPLTDRARALVNLRSRTLRASSR